MTHQTLISSTPLCCALYPHFLHASPSFSPVPSYSSSSSTSASCTAAPAMASFVAHHHGSLVERDSVRMTALKSSHMPCEAAEETAADRGAGLFGEGFSVEDLLDLEELCEMDNNNKDVTGLGEAAPSPAVEEDKSSDSQHGTSSSVTYELMPLPPAPVMDLPAHDAEEFEWVSRIMDDSLAELPPAPHIPAAAFALRRQQQQHEPAVPRMVPVPTPTVCALSTEAPFVPVKAKRSKRSRGSVWSLSSAAPLSDSTSSSSTTTTSSCSSSSASFPPLLLLDSNPFAASHLLLEQQPPRSNKKSKHGKNGSNKPKKRGRKPKHQPRPQVSGGDASAPAPGDRRCSHCGVQKTPQWRAGPEGAKTLCNACGVRYKSGRLLPEYRPACSPTFVSSIHSNSHRKVLEMRRKKEGLIVPPATAPAVASF